MCLYNLHVFYAGSNTVGIRTTTGFVMPSPSPTTGTVLQAFCVTGLLCVCLKMWAVKQCNHSYQVLSTNFNQAFFEDILYSDNYKVAKCR